MSRKYLVTGGAGYVGSHACKALAKAGHTPVVFDNFILGHPSAVQWGPVFEGDLHDEQALNRLFSQNQFDGVLHFAAFAYVGESVLEPFKYYENNVAGTLSLLKMMMKHKVKNLVFSSTCATYGVPEKLPIEEGFPQAPINPYGHSKLIVEQILKDLCHLKKLKVGALRYFNAAGADPELEIGEDHEPETHIIPLAIRAALKGDTFNVLGNDYPTPDGTCVRDYIHVTDLADGHVRALEYLDQSGEFFHAWNLGTGKGFSVLEILSEIEKKIGKKIPVQVSERRPGDPPTLIASGAKARKELGWSPDHSDLDQIISTALAWYRKLNS